MKNKNQNLTNPFKSNPTIISIIFFISLHLITVSSYTQFSPLDHHLINCGSSAESTTDLFNRVFTGDESATGSFHFSKTHSISIRNPNPNPDGGISPIYDTARIFTGRLKYSFLVRDRGTHLIRIHFLGFNFSGFDCSSIRFHVLANGYLLVHDFDGLRVRNGEIREYMLWVDGERVEIEFIPAGKKDFGFVSAIEMISAPKDLVLDCAKFVRSDGVYGFSGLSKNGFETMYRVNVGGPLVTPFNDSLWRTWVPDNQFLALNGVGGWKRSYFGGRINYRLGGASREVGPDNVYNTARVITSSNGTIPRSNLTWSFPVIEGYEYFVRVHFCDIRSDTIGLLYLNVYVNGNLAYENLDLSMMTGHMLASPFYADFVVNVGDSNMMTVSVGPSSFSVGSSSLSVPNAVDAILNGVEIFKMNNSLGSFDGDVTPVSILKSCRRGNIGVIVSLLAAMCLFVAASVVLRRGKFGDRNSVAWSRLPVDVSDVNLKS
ncbi:hypothetical protein Droror1_Dr00000538 [Drosera rotundifolia]